MSTQFYFHKTIVFLLKIGEKVDSPKVANRRHNIVRYYNERER